MHRRIPTESLSTKTRDARASGGFEDWKFFTVIEQARGRLAACHHMGWETI
jgi:hypothetical protein